MHVAIVSMLLVALAASHIYVQCHPQVLGLLSRVVVVQECDACVVKLVPRRSAVQIVRLVLVITLELI